MIINRLTALAQQFLPEQNAEPDELSVNFDFALSAEMLDVLYAQNQAVQLVQAANAGPYTRVELDEHERALA